MRSWIGTLLLVAVPCATAARPAPLPLNENSSEVTAAADATGMDAGELDLATPVAMPSPQFVNWAQPPRTQNLRLHERGGLARPWLYPGAADPGVSQDTVG